MSTIWRSTVSSLPLASSTWDIKEREALLRVIDSGQLTMGTEVSHFERRFAEWVGAEYCVMVNSGSSANLLAVASLFYTDEEPLQRGDEVVVPAVSWSTTFFPLLQYGLRVRFVDIDPLTLNVDLGKLERAVTDRTRLIMLVNLLGNPNDFERVREIIGDRRVRVVEDNCEGLGARFNSKHAGTFGDLGTFSTFFSHHMVTMEGGMVVTDNEELYHILLCLRAHGWTRNLPPENRITGSKSDDWFEESWRFVLPGYNVRPLELSGAVGSVQLEKVDAFIRARRANAALVSELFSDHPRLILQQEVGQSSWFGFGFTLREGGKSGRRRLLSALERAGVEFRPIVAGNFCRNPVVRFFDYEIAGDLPAADRVHEAGFLIGNHHFAIDESLRSFRRAVDDHFESSVERL
jgi:CDP-4-dehydro-6-deoxyglucose reductase, E1